MTFENGGLYNNIEPIPIKEFISYSVWNKQIIKIKKETNRKKITICLFRYPERDLNPHSRNGQRILSPSCLPFHHPGGKQY